METDEELLQRFYATGDNDFFLDLLRRYSEVLDRFLTACVRDKQVIVEIWKSLVQIVRQSRRHPECRFDVRRGPVKGFLFSIAGHLAYGWLVELRDPRDFS
jgi:hypothetical protein